MGILEIRAAAKSQAKAFSNTQKLMKTAHQWEVDDLIAAGLNPILSATSGSPSMATSAAPAVSGDAIGGGITGLGGLTSTAKDAAGMKSQLSILKTQETTAKHEAKRVGNVADKEHQLANSAKDLAVIDANNRAVSNAALSNRIAETRAVRELDRTGIDTPFGRLQGEDLRKWNALVKRYRGTAATQ